MSSKTRTIPTSWIIGAIILCTFIAGVLIGGTTGLVTLIGAGLLLFLVGALSVIASNRAAHNRADTDRDLSQISRARTHAILEMASTLGATLDYKAVLDAAMDIGVLGLRDVAQKSRLVSMALLFENDHLKVTTSRRLPQRDLTITVPGRTGVLARALDTAEPIYANRPVNDPELSYFAGFQDAQSVLVIPLRANLQNYGLLVFGTPQPNAFSAIHAETLSAISTQATIALQNAVLYQNLRDEKERIVEIEEDARKKLARDLHDGPTQSVGLIAMRVNLIRKNLESAKLNIPVELEKVEALAKQTTKEIRHMLFTLRPLVLETQGLVAALGQLRLKTKETHDQDVILQIQQGVEELLDVKQQGVLFYIIDEAVNNARKHAQAAHIIVRLLRRDNHLIAEVQDNGVGFDVNEVDSNYHQRSSLGMLNMRERAELIGGQVRVESARGKGTKISVIVPVQQRQGANGAKNDIRSPADQRAGQD